jgi:hypothetical protein
MNLRPYLAVLGLCVVSLAIWATVVDLLLP